MIPRPFGEVVRRRTLGAFTLTEVAYAPHLRIPRHAHAQAYVTVVLAGGYSEACAAGTRSCATSTVILHETAEEHADRFARDGARCLDVEFAPGWLERVRDTAGGFDRSLQCDGGTASTVAMKLYRELHAADELSPLAVEGLTLELLAALARGAARPPREAWIDDARTLLQARFAEPITLAAVAASVGVHPVHLARTFRARYGSTVGEYVRQLRVQYACRRLCETTDSLADIALGAGFSHQSHFTAAFRRATGLTPGRYRTRSAKRT